MRDIVSNNIFFDVGIASGKILSEISRLREIYFQEMSSRTDLKRDLSRDIVSNEMFTSDIISNNIFQCIVSSKMSIKISIEMKSYPVSRKSRVVYRCHLKGDLFPRILSEGYYPERHLWREIFSSEFS